MAGKSHYTFNNSELDRIGRENLSLLNRLAGVATRRPGAVGGPPAASGAPKSSFAINRNRAAREIEEQNLRLLRRLQGTKSNLAKEIGLSGGGGGGGIHSRHRGASSTVVRAAERKPWVDTSGSLAAVEERERSRQAATGGGGGGGGGGGRPQFSSRDIKDIALEACPEKHLL